MLAALAGLAQGYGSNATTDTLPPGRRSASAPGSELQLPRQTPQATQMRIFPNLKLYIPTFS